VIRVQLDLSDHHAHDVFARQVADQAGSDRFAVAQDGRALADVEYLIQKVRNIDDRHPFLLEGFDGLKEPLSLATGEGRGWLVEDDDARIDQQSTTDLHKL